MSSIFNPLADVTPAPQVAISADTDKSTAIFNPLSSILTSTSSPYDTNTSESAVTNTDVGVCPKCKSGMTRAVITNQDTVYFCATCRVSSPLQD
jgi:hypothetical protein